MRNIDYPYDHEYFLEMWQKFRQRNQGQLVGELKIDPLIAGSWQRCEVFFKQTIFDSYSHPRRSHLETLIDQHAELISVAVPYLEDIHDLIEGAASAVILTDKEGRVLVIEGRLTSANTMHKIGLTPGECWSEETMGTNAIGLCLVTAMPTQVLGAEHYLQIFHDYGASAAPIHDEHGAITGTIAVITYAEKTNQSQLALVMATARAITNQLQSNFMLEQVNQRLRQLDLILESVTDGVITWNLEGNIEQINHLACQMMGVRRSSMFGKPLHELMFFPAHVQQAIDGLKELSDVETRIQVGDRIVKCLISVRNICDGAREIIGGVAMFRPLSQVRLLVNQQTSNLPDFTFDDFAYESSEMQALLHQAKTAAKGSAAVLLVGEWGVGKTILAQAIHNASPRMNKPFVIFSCGMLPVELMVKELLGKEAYEDQHGRPSKFELADGGTLVFDMIDQLSLEAQQLLLNVINSRHVNRLYATHTTSVNVRIIATTSQDIEHLVQQNSFLPQLYYLFNAFRLYIPPLRERRKDIVRLAMRFLERSRADDTPYEFEPEVMRLLQNYPWPGNVRELESVIERAVVHANEWRICALDLPENIRTEHSMRPDSRIPQQVISLQEAEREAIIMAGWAYRGVISDMALALGINRSTLWRKLKTHNIFVDEFKNSVKRTSSSGALQNATSLKKI